jgi:hypothetical protein
MHLVDQLILAHRSKVLMSPRVSSDLVAVRMHPSQHGWVPRLLDIDLALTHVVACDEKGGLGAVASQNI